MRLGTVMLKAFITRRHGRALSRCEATELLTVVMQLRLGLAQRGLPAAPPEELDALTEQLFTPAQAALLS